MFCFVLFWGFFPSWFSILNDLDASSPHPWLHMGICAGVVFMVPRMICKAIFWTEREGEADRERETDRHAE